MLHGLLPGVALRIGYFVGIAVPIYLMLEFPGDCCGAIGGTASFAAVSSLTGTLVGAILLTRVPNGMILLAVRAKWQRLAAGVIVLFSAWTDIITRQRPEARA